jgi:hypothetical protein
MKFLITTILYITIVFTAKAQKTVESNVISFALPKGSQKLSAATFNDQFRKTFKRPTEAFTDGTSIHYNNLFITFHEKRVALNKIKTLEKWKKELEDLYKTMFTLYDVSKIIEVNNRHYLIFQEHSGNEYQIYFCSETINNMNISGYIIFKEEHKIEACDYLDNFLKGLKYDIL